MPNLIWIYKWRARRYHFMQEGVSAMWGSATDFERRLLDMLQSQIVARGLTNPLILEAMQRVPRHLFAPPDQLKEAYQDHPITLPEERATISQPYMVAYMTDALQCRPSDRVLEIGTGSGYQTAILSHLCREVYTVERHESLTLYAKRIIHTLGRENVFFLTGDGVEGWKDHAPYDKILVTAAARIPPSALLDQLSDGGMLLIPLGESHIQTLTRIQKKENSFQEEKLITCVFVPLISRSRDMTLGNNSDFFEYSSQ